jgi:hypothetical protein
MALHVLPIVQGHLKRLLGHVFKSFNVFPDHFDPAEDGQKPVGRFAGFRDFGQYLER